MQECNGDEGQHAIEASIRPREINVATRRPVEDLYPSHHMAKERCPSCLMTLTRLTAYMPSERYRGAVEGRAS